MRWADSHPNLNERDADKPKKHRPRFDFEFFHFDFRFQFRCLDRKVCMVKQRGLVTPWAKIRLRHTFNTFERIWFVFSSLIDFDFDWNLLLSGHFDSIRFDSSFCLCFHCRNFRSNRIIQILSSINWSQKERTLLLFTEDSDSRGLVFLFYAQTHNEKGLRGGWYICVCESLTNWGRAEISTEAIFGYSTFDSKSTLASLIEWKKKKNKKTSKTIYFSFSP